MIQLLTGDDAVSQAVRLARVQVIAAYPITPQTQIYEKLNEFTSTGVLPAHMIRVESEFSAMAACQGASQAGARTFTATASQGLAYMHELLHFVAGDRLPVVMVNVNRAIAAPWSFWSDQTDSLAQRDTGWLQLYTEGNQEALDSVLQAYRIAEQLLLPVMVVLEGFYVSHTMEPVEVPDQALVDRYLPPYRPAFRLDPRDPHNFNSTTTAQQYHTFRYKMQETMERAKEVATGADDEFQEVFGRSYGLVNGYRLEDAEMVLVIAGTIASTAREVIDACRARGERVGLLRIRFFRPFPAEQVRQALAGAAKIGVIDKNISIGHGGIFCSEVRAAMYNTPSRAPIFGFLAGVGGLDVTPDTLHDIIGQMRDTAWPKEDNIWVEARQ